MDPATVHAQLTTMVGQPIGQTTTSTGPDPVNQPMIRHWAAAFEDANPVYTDPAAAARSRFGHIVSPPLMLQTWTMATPKITGIKERGGSPVESRGPGPLTLLDEAGYPATLATNAEYEVDRYVGLGEVISATTVLESVSEEKRTKLGPGFFVTWLTTYLDGDGQPVGRQRFRILRFRPEGAGR